MPKVVTIPLNYKGLKGEEALFEFNADLNRALTLSYNVEVASKLFNKVEKLRYEIKYDDDEL